MSVSNSTALVLVVSIAFVTLLLRMLLLVHLLVTLLLSADILWVTA